ncbi:hypothetical protein FDC35_16030 [Clostridium botulinum]|uniref:hypothetical protein n=1 Tax=Clostridium sp. ZS6 TaxID=2949987 RepID=UPI0013F09241|nr:hypothetical protein [Clostridium sp. ZS6]MBN1038821.1 hypothetical protein [Clostridium botulinum]NFH70745.1 hypothetical protein [Clostridium botulinum]NFI57515.1 hypothetical protein [Clostridium botulinum]NFP02345.1 hypothetical protein [Clostridium botulinum]
MNSKEDILAMLKKLVRCQYIYEQDALEIGGKQIKSEKELARLYKKLIDKEVDEIENRENSLT